jgi:flagellar biosynthetic protein FliO
MASGFSGADLFRLLASMALVLALMGALLWALRRLQGRMNSQNPGRRLQLIEALSVVTRQNIALVRVGEREVLIGISAAQMCALASWPQGADLNPTVSEIQAPSDPNHAA